MEENQSITDSDDESEFKSWATQLLDVFKLPKQTDSSFINHYIETILKNDKTKLKQYLHVKTNVDSELGLKKWKEWLDTKNKYLEQMGREKYIKNILKMTKADINYTLRQFIMEIRNENGKPFPPDIVHYFCVSMQKYLYEHNRPDNIFADTQYLEFMSYFDDIAEKFSGIYSDSKYIVTEENMWECKLLGTKTPFVLLTTILYYNTLHLNLKTTQDHMNITFKDFKRKKNKNNEIESIKYNIPLMQLNSENMKNRKFEIQKNETNPLRCPVRLFDFYVEKCPEAVRNNERFFYMLPDVNCKPTSSIWFTIIPASNEMVSRIFNRLKMIKEINDVFHQSSL